jgi:hypothetical protein
MNLESHDVSQKCFLTDGQQQQRPRSFCSRGISLRLHPLETYYTVQPGETQMDLLKQLYTIFINFTTSAAVAANVSSFLFAKKLNHGLPRNLAPH